ncbi:MAG: EipA family protein [Janthinobacterium lividum]
MRKARMIAAVTAIACAIAPATAQVRTVDPNQAIDQDLSGYRAPAANRSGRQDATRAVAAPAVDTAVDSTAPVADQDDPQTAPAPAGRPSDRSSDRPSDRQYGAGRNDRGSSEPARERRADATSGADATFHRDDLIGAGENVFGKGAQGFAGIVEKILKDQGEPNAYIAGREASGAFVVGLRYGSGIMTHKVEGQMPVYWTGPSVGFDFGGDANKVFVLVYNLYDTAELYHRFPHGEGHLYFVGGFSATYLRWGHVVLIPVRLGVGVRAGVNVGYMKFTRKSKWLPF